MGPSSYLFYRRPSSYFKNIFLKLKLKNFLKLQSKNVLKTKTKK